MNSSDRTLYEHSAYVDYSDWIKGREPVSIATNAGAPPLAFQNWRRFKEAFAPELVDRAVRETSAALGRRVQTCVDPFSGSGTTPLTCQFLGVFPTAIEVNPYLADLTEAKLTPVDPQTVARRLAEVLANGQAIDPVSFYRNGPSTFVEPGVGGRYLFSHDVASRLASLLNAILSIREEPIRRLFRVLLGAAALDVCNATVSGKGRRYRKNWQLRTVSPAELDLRFSSSVKSAMYDVVRFARRSSTGFHLIRGDAREHIRNVADVDLAVFSPPYLNSFDYTDVYNVELWALGYLRSSEDNLALRQATLRSHVQIKRDMSSLSDPPPIAHAVKQLRSVPKLWNPWIPDMIGAYFADIRLVMKSLWQLLPIDGRIYMIVGDSRYSGVRVPVIDGLTYLADELGYKVQSVEPIRLTRASHQQGGRVELQESLLILSAS